MSQIGHICAQFELSCVLTLCNIIQSVNSYYYIFLPNLFIGVCSFSITLVRSQAVSFVIPLGSGRLTYFMKNPKGAINYQAYTEPIHNLTWLLIGVFCVILPIFLVATIK